MPPHAHSERRLDEVARTIGHRNGISDRIADPRGAPIAQKGLHAGDVLGARQPKRYHMFDIEEAVVVEQILIRNLPAGTKAALRARAEQHHRSVEAEAREILAEAVASAPPSIVDLVSMDDGSDIEFEPDRLPLAVRTAQL